MKALTAIQHRDLFILDFNKQILFFYDDKYFWGKKGDWDFRISDLVKKPDETDVESLW